jgi:hypothetical protein
MKRGTPDHPKVRALARSLSVNHAWAVGILELMWHFAAQYAPRGDVGRYSDEEIAEACSWPIERSSELVDALVSCGFLDRHDQYRLVVHDWHDHADSAVHYRLARARERFAGGQIPRLDGLHSSQRAEAMQAYGLLHKSEQETNGCNPLESQDGVPVHSTARQGTSTARQGTSTELPRRATARQGTPRNAVAVAESRSRKPKAESRKPEPAGCNAAGLPEWVAAVEAAITSAVGRPPRHGTAIQLIRQAADMGAHPRYLAKWITERNGSPPRSDGLYVSILAQDLRAWLSTQEIYRAYLPVDQAECQRCNAKVTAFRDLVVPCACDQKIPQPCEANPDNESRESD